MKAVIIDDESKARKALAVLLKEYCPDVNIIGEAGSPDSGIKLIEQANPDIVFLDIEMPGGNGFSLLNSFDEVHFEVIFTTAYNEYALKAIKHSALDYLLKPIDADELKMAISKFKKKKASAIVQNEEPEVGMISGFDSGNTPINKLILPVPKGFKIVATEQIIYCAASGSYTEIYLNDKSEIVVAKSLKYFEELLSKYNFFRVHDSSLINLFHVVEFVKGRGGQAILTDGTIVDISRDKKNAFLKKFQS